MNNAQTNPELVGIEVEGLTRSSFLVKGALATSAVYGGSMVAPFVRQAIAQEGMGDIEILNFALTLEYLEAEFYARGLKSAGLSGDVKKLATQLRSDEDAHVEALIATIKQLGGKAVKAPAVKFPFRDEKSFLELAQVFEDTGVSAYNGAAPAIQSVEILAAAGSIVQIEARHAAAIRLTRGESPTDGAFDKSLEAPAVLKAVKPFIAA